MTESLILQYDPSRLDVHLIGGGSEALALAQRISGLMPVVTVHAVSLMPALASLCRAQEWAVRDDEPVVGAGQLWLVASGDGERDREVASVAVEAGVAVYAPAHPTLCSVRLPPRVTVNDTAQPASASADGHWQRGHVSLVGAGPGDPELLTLKALKRLQRADVVIHDRLVSQEILALANPAARRFYVGKARSRHSVPQEGINQALVDWARAGNQVVRLKGGDPFIFGRGGEELEALVAAGVDFDVVPGITAASGCAAYAGIPLTHRDHAQSVRFVTGHLKNGSCDLDWSALARGDQTLVFYMGLGALDLIRERLMAYGLDGATPLALIEQGTTANQRVHLGTLSRLPDSLAEHQPRPPTLIVVGSVVELASRLEWFQPTDSGSLGWVEGKHPTPLSQADSA
ncbi:uroporphyrinogen-III C-methyltransferase [Salinicola halimionae]|uniref:uroporphyrinogen-III C-methyltransferase n=1 Tax=Salinicola halimionae TaxID=1949081 RepID=UPI003CC95305